MPTLHLEPKPKRTTPRPQIDKKKIRAPQIVVKVTEELIYEATQRDSSHCMISEAIAIAMPKASRISTDLQTIRLTIPDMGYRFTYLTPRIAQEGLINFDQGVPPEPFKFALRNPIHIGYMTSKSASQKQRDSARRARIKEATKDFAVGDSPEALAAGIAAAVKKDPVPNPNKGKRIQMASDGASSKDGNRGITVIGGKPPPKSNLSDGPGPRKSNLGHRREFGLRQLRK
jgi:hypothetical protein